MGIIKIKGKWGIDYYADGERYRKVIGDGKSKTLASNALHSIKTKIAEGEYLPNKRNGIIKVDKILEEYWNIHLKYRKSADRSEYYYNCCKKKFGHLPIGRLTKKKIIAYQRRRANERRLTGKGKESKYQIKPSTVNKTITFLSTAINFAIKMDKISFKNPCEGVERLPENNVRDIVINDKEFQTLITHLPEYLKPVVTFAYYTGCRKSEILNLKKSDINLFANVCHIRDTKNDEDRYVPIAEPLKDILKNSMDHKNGSEYVFTGMYGEKIVDFAKAWRTARKKAKLFRLCFHDLRHTCITNWHNQGHSHFLIMDASGHKTLSCFKRYLSFKNNDLQKLVSASSGHPIDTKKNVISCNVS